MLPTIVISAIIAVLLYKIIAAREAAAHEQKMLVEIEKEIAHNAQALRVKRQQTVQKDEYGTWHFKKWTEAKQYYVSTRIAPILSRFDCVALSPELAAVVDGMIEEVASNPLPPGAVEPCAFTSSPEVYDPRMHPLDYEAYCAMQLQKAGWDTRTTVATGDQGADVIAVQSRKMLVVQCKLYSSSVGNDAVQQVISAKLFQSAQIAAVVSNQPYTRSAKQLASSSHVYLLHHEELASFRPAELAVGG